MPTTAGGTLSLMLSCIVSGKKYHNNKKISLCNILKTFQVIILSDGRYLDQLGMASIYGTKTYCRQSLIGGNYGLLNTTNFKPNPDYYR